MDNERTVVADPFENHQMGYENQKEEQKGCNILFAKNIQNKSFAVYSLATATPLVVEGP